MKTLSILTFFFLFFCVSSKTSFFFVFFFFPAQFPMFKLECLDYLFFFSKTLKMTLIWNIWFAAASKKHCLEMLTYLFWTMFGIKIISLIWSSSSSRRTAFFAMHVCINVTRSAAVFTFDKWNSFFFFFF